MPRPNPSYDPSQNIDQRIRHLNSACGIDKKRLLAFSDGFCSNQKSLYRIEIRMHRIGSISSVSNLRRFICANNLFGKKGNFLEHMNASLQKPDRNLRSFPRSGGRRNGDAGEIDVIRKFIYLGKAGDTVLRRGSSRPFASAREDANKLEIIRHRNGLQMNSPECRSANKDFRWLIFTQIHLLAPSIKP